MVRARPTESRGALSKPLSRKAKRFYVDYCKFVRRELERPRIKSFVAGVIEEEGIAAHMVRKINVKVYPFGASEDDRVYAKREKISIRKSQYFGHYLCYVRRIDIYPPRLHPAFIEGTTAKQLWDDRSMRRYLYLYEPLSTLIHEYLHVKYRSERTVDRLSRRYMIRFEMETRGKVEYSDKVPFCIWLDHYIMDLKKKGFKPQFR
jgi:hypothetical protein